MHHVPPFKEGKELLTATVLLLMDPGLSSEASSALINLWEGTWEASCFYVKRHDRDFCLGQITIPAC